MATLTALAHPRTAGQSLWTATGAPAPAAPCLTESISADTVIIGAGIAGLSTALHLARDGHDVVVLEAEQAPQAATSASAGIVAPQLVRTTPSAVMKKLGDEAGSRLLGAVAQAGGYTFDLIREEDIACAAVQAGFLAPFTRSSPGLVAGVEQWRAFRDDLEILDADQTQALSGCRGYAGAVLDKSGGGLNPVAYGSGLARGIGVHGGRLYRESRVQSLQRVGAGWRAETAAGSVEARRVVICANGGATALHPALAGSVLPLPVCEVATLPLPADLRAAILPHGHTLTDLATDIFSIRLDAEGRLITACPAPERIDAVALTEAINKRLAIMLPSWRPTPLEYIWTGIAWLNSDLLPRIADVDENLIAVQACNGRGLALNSLAGREAALWVKSGGRAELALPFAPPKPVRGFFLARHIPRLIMAGARISKLLSGQTR